jgi:hypothetical protein
MLYQLSYASSLGNMPSKARYPHIRSLSGTTSKYHNGNPRATGSQVPRTRLALEEPAAALSGGFH